MLCYLLEIHVLIKKSEVMSHALCLIWLLFFFSLEETCRSYPFPKSLETSQQCLLVWAFYKIHFVELFLSKNSYSRKHFRIIYFLPLIFSALFLKFHLFDVGPPYYSFLFSYHIFYFPPFSISFASLFYGKLSHFIFQTFLN